MAIKLIANYSKRLGLPGFSSHQFSVEIEAELASTDEVSREATRIYRLLQSNVDEQIRATGFVPSAEYGLEHQHPPSGTKPWKCTPKQKKLIEDLVEEHRLEKAHVEAVASGLFGKGVRQLSNAEASTLIDELIANRIPTTQPPSLKPAHRYTRRAA